MEKGISRVSENSAPGQAPSIFLALELTYRKSSDDWGVMEDRSDTIYRQCRRKAKESSKGKRFGSSDKAADELYLALEETGPRENCYVSRASVKDYESGKTVPSPETVKLMSEVYGTPELKWLHCTYGCPLGKEITNTKKNIGTGDIYRTYFELVGAFNLVGRIEGELHSVIEDERFCDEEAPAMDEILKVLDRINESTKELRIWVEKQRGKSGEALSGS